MSDEKKYTEREMVLAQREAFRRGALHPRLVRGSPDFDELAREYYPLPRVTRPRVVADPDMWDGVAFKSDGCNIYWNKRGGEWLRYPDSIRDLFPFPSKARVTLWADLLANPTETVEDTE